MLNCTIQIFFKLYKYIFFYVTAILLKKKNIESNALRTCLTNSIGILLQKIANRNALVPIQFTNQTNERCRD